LAGGSAINDGRGPAVVEGAVAVGGAVAVEGAVAVGGSVWSVLFEQPTTPSARATKAMMREMYTMNFLIVRGEFATAYAF